MTNYLKMVGRLAEVGWTVERLSRKRALPMSVVARYPSMPLNYRQFAESFGNVSSPGDRAWLVTSEVFCGSGSAFAWNEWELQSLAAAGDDRTLVPRIGQFWDRHLPVVMSVKSGYAHFSLDLETMTVVQGEEPEYEDVSRVASSVDELFQSMAARDPKLTPWL